jgi:hypothetical protein
VPDGLRRRSAQRQWLLEETSQLVKFELAVLGSGWLKKVRTVIPRSDQMWGLVLIAAAWSVQIVEKPSDATASEDLPDHGPPTSPSNMLMSIVPP